MTSRQRALLTRIALVRILLPVARSGDNTAIPPDTYNREYLLSASLEGYEEYLRSELSAIKRRQIEMLDLNPHVALLDIGFGRGDVLRHCAPRCGSVTGVDYSPDACEIARETLRGVANADVRVADCRALPFADETFDRVYSGDVIEHLAYADGVKMLREAWRVLKPGGFLLVHTSPNSLFIRFVYPATRGLLRLLSAGTVRRLDQHLATGRRVHVFEFNLLSLRRIAREAGLPDAEVWIDADLLRSGSTWHTRELQANRLVRLAAALGRFAPVRFLLGNDLYPKCAKPAV